MRGLWRLLRAGECMPERRRSQAARAARSVCCSIGAQQRARGSDTLPELRVERRECVRALITCGAGRARVEAFAARWFGAQRLRSNAAALPCSVAFLLSMSSAVQHACSLGMAADVTHWRASRAPRRTAEAKGGQHTRAAASIRVPT